MAVRNRRLEDVQSNNSSRSASRVRTPMPDGEENGQLDFNFNNLEELLSSKLENLEGWLQKNYDFKQETVTELNKSRITSSSSINELIKSLHVSRTEVSSESRELVLAQLYKLIVIKSLINYNEEKYGTSDYVGESSVQDLVELFMRGDYRSAQEFLLLYRSIIALIASDINEFSDLADSEFINHIKRLITEPATSAVTNENKSHLISGYVGLLLITNNGSSAFGIDEVIEWLFEITEGFCASAVASLKEFDEGDREYSTFFDDLSKQRIVNDISSKQHGESLIGVSGLHGVGCLLTLLPRNDFLNEIIEKLVPSLIELLDNEVDMDISKASGRLIGLCYEIYNYSDDEPEDDDDEYNYNAPYYEQEQLISTLTRLTGLFSQKLAKKDKREVRSIFRDVLNTVECYAFYDKRIEILKRSPEGVELLDNMMDSNYIKLSRTRSIQINSWFLYLRLIHLKWCFGFGVHNQLISNELVRDVLKAPPTEFESKYGQNDELSDDEFEYRGVNAQHELNDKKRSIKLKKEQYNKLTENMGDLELK